MRIDIKYKHLNILKSTIAIIAIALCSNYISAQTKTEGGVTRIDGNVEFDKTIHDFGDVMINDGPLSCTFNIKNISKQPMAIYNVVSSCGCTNVHWTREPIQAGGKGKISATYSNDEGPYPFEKTLTVYFSNIKKPVILRLRGSSHNKKLPLSQLYPIHFGNLGVKGIEFKCGNITPGSQKGDAIDVANIGGSPIEVTLSSITPGLKAEIFPNPIPPNSTAKINYVVTAEKGKWGKNLYSIKPIVDGKSYMAEYNGKTYSKLTIWTFTKEDFSKWSASQKDKAAQPVFEKSTYDFNKVKKGEVINAEFKFTNKGKSPFEIYKADTDNEAAVANNVPVVPEGKSGKISIRINTGNIPKGDVMIVVTLTTNTPIRPIINLFITGFID